MPLSVRPALLAAIPGLILLGCNRSNPPAGTQPQPVNIGQESPKTQPAPSTPNVADPDRRAGEWVLQVDGSIRILADGVPVEIKKGGKLPNGPVKLLAIDLSYCPKATDDGRDRLRGLSGLRELTTNDDAKIRNFDFLAT